MERKRIRSGTKGKHRNIYIGGKTNRELKERAGRREMEIKKYKMKIEKSEASAKREMGIIYCKFQINI